MINWLKIVIFLIKIKSSDDNFFLCEKKFIERVNFISDWILDLCISNESKFENEFFFYNLYMYIYIICSIWNKFVVFKVLLFFIFVILCFNLEKGGGGIMKKMFLYI